MRKLYRFHWRCGRSGNLHGLFVADESEVEDAIGKDLYFGEVLGKHSEIGGTLENGDVHVVTDDQNFIEQFERLDCSTGFNPLHHLRYADGDEEGGEQ